MPGAEGGAAGSTDSLTFGEALRRASDCGRLRREVPGSEARDLGAAGGRGSASGAAGTVESFVGPGLEGSGRGASRSAGGIAAGSMLIRRITDEGPVFELFDSLSTGRASAPDETDADRSGQVNGSGCLAGAGAGSTGFVAAGPFASGSLRASSLRVEPTGSRSRLRSRRASLDFLLIPLPPAPSRVSRPRRPRACDWTPWRPGRCGLPARRSPGCRASRASKSRSNGRTSGRLG